MKMRLHWLTTALTTGLSTLPAHIAHCAASLRARSRRSASLLITWMLLALMLVAAPNGFLASATAFAAPVPPPATTPATNRPNQGPSNQVQRHDPIPPVLAPNRKPLATYKPPSYKTPTNPVNLHAPVSMRPATLSLSPTSALDFTGSDGRFELLAPAGAISPADVTSAGGRLQLRVEQIAGASGSTTSGRVLFGTYQITVLGPHGPLSLFTFHRPLTFRYHLSAAEQAVTRPGTFVLTQDGTITPTTTTTGASGTQPTTSQPTAWPSSTTVEQSTHPATLDASSQTLTYTTSGSSAVVSGLGTTTATFGSPAPVATWGTVQDFQTDLNAGALSYSVPLDVPTGPNGIKPALQLAYSSGSVNETEGVQSAASWVGEGWSLALGSISWSQLYGDAAAETGLPLTENEWQITTPDGISGQLIPPDMNTTTYGSWTLPSTPQWYTAPESHTKIIELKVNNYPCFRLWLPDGTLEEYGCTSDSRQYYTQNNTQYTYRWDLDMIADTHGNQILPTYTQTTSNGNIVDAVLADVYYDIPSCLSTTTRCATSAALVDVHFDSSTTKPARVTSTTCTSWSGPYRCDDPAPASGGLPAPTVMSVHVLNDVKVNVRPTASGSYNMLRTYYLWYEQNKGANVKDPATGLQEVTAGYLDLTQVQEFGTDATSGPSGTSYPPLSFSYDTCTAQLTSQCSQQQGAQQGTINYQEHYEDLSEPSQAGCAPWYNAGGTSGTGWEDIEVVEQEGGQLVDYWRDSSAVWHTGVTFGSYYDSSNHLITVVSAAASVIRGQAVNGQAAYLDVVAALSNGVFGHFVRDPQGRWSATPVDTFGSWSGSPAPTPSLTYDSALKSLEVLVHQGSQLAHYSYSGSPATWSGGTGSQLFGTTITGDPAITYDASNSELDAIALTGGIIQHYSTTYSNGAWNSWTPSGTFGSAQDSYTGLSLDYNSYSGSSPLPGALEVVVTQNGNLAYWHGTVGTSSTWTGPVVDSTDSVDSGPSGRVAAQNGHLEVVAQVPAPNNTYQLGHFWIGSNLTWTHDATFGDPNLTGVQPGEAYNSNAECYDQWFNNPSPNTPALWAQTYSQRYLTVFNNGRGLQELFTWAEAHMNVWGGYNGQPSADPLSCTGLETSNPCFRADDRSWSRIILARSDSIVDRTTQVNGTTTTTPIDDISRYTYFLTPVQQADYYMPSDPYNLIQGGLYTWSWGSTDSQNWLTYYNPEFRGFQEATVGEWESDDGGATNGTHLSSTDHFYYTSSGWGVWDTAEVNSYVGHCYNIASLCPNAPYWSQANALPGREYQTDYYAIDSAGNIGPLLKQVDTSYNAVAPNNGDETWGNTLDTCRPNGDPNSPTLSNTVLYWVNYAYYDSKSTTPPDLSKVGMLVSQLSHLSNPVAVCDPRPVSQDTFYVEGTSTSQQLPSTCTPSTTSLPCTHVTYSYDGTGAQAPNNNPDHGNVIQQQTTGDDLGGQTTNQLTQYATEDTVNTTSATGTYIVNAQTQQSVQDGSGNVLSLAQTFYDGQNGSLGGLGTYGEVTEQQQATAPVPGVAGTYYWAQRFYAYDDSASGNNPGAGNALAERMPNGQSGACTIANVGYSTCAAYDSSSSVAYDTHPTSVTNALGQVTTTAYTDSNGYDIADGWGQWLTSSTDANNATTTYAYDALGRLLALKQPAATASETQQFTYLDNCPAPAAGPSAPCIELDTTQWLNSATSATSRTFTDGAGNTAETESPAPSGSGTLVSYTLYDALGRKVFASEPYTVATTSTYSIPDLTQPGTQYAYDALGRQTSAQLAPSYGANPTAAAKTSYGVSSSIPTRSDTAPYEHTTTIDPNQHQSDTVTDALGQTVYTIAFSGNSTPQSGGPAPYTAYAVTQAQYDALGRTTQITYPDNTHTTTYGYDMRGLVTSETDPDRGMDVSWGYTYDSDGNLVHARDSRQVSTYTGYDALDRPLWRNTTNSSSGAYVTFSYDSTAPYCPPHSPLICYDGHSDGKGRLTGETFSEPGTSLSGSYAIYYDANGRVMGDVQATNGTSYYMSSTYNDAGQPVTTTYPDGEKVTVDYTSAGAPQDMQSTVSGTTTWLVSSVTYAGTGKIASLGFGGSPSAGPAFTESFTYDPFQHLTQQQAALPGASNPFYSLALTYDAAYNVISATTTLPAVGSTAGGTEQQSFCYDEQNRLVWAGTNGTPTGPADGAGTCGSSPQPDTLLGGGYTATYAYDNLNRLTTGPAGSYTYGDPHHLDAVTSASSGFSASYDTAGNMTCRATDATQTCAGSTPTGAQLTYDNEGRLEQWQSPSGTTASTDTYLYDASGARVAQQVATSGYPAVTTVYVGALADYTGSTHVNHYAFAGRLIGLRDSSNGAVHYLLVDQISSPELQLSAAGAAEAVTLRTPYGASRYGASDLYNFGFTSQRQDDTTGLSYDNARYYDPTIGQFISADSDPKGGLNHYVYVGGDPEGLTDPTGHWVCEPGDPSRCQPPPPRGSKIKDLGFQNLCNSRFGFTSVCGISDGHYGWFDMWGDVIETIQPNGSILWSYRGSREGPDQCDTVCHNQRAGAAAHAVSDGKNKNFAGSLAAFLGGLLTEMDFGTFLSHVGEWALLIAGVLISLAVVIGSILLALTTVETLVGFIGAINAAMLAFDGLIHAIGAMVALAAGDHSQQYLNYVGGIQATVDYFTFAVGAISLIILSGGAATEGVSAVALLGTRFVVGGGAAFGFVNWVVDAVTAGFLNTEPF